MVFFLPERMIWTEPYNKNEINKFAELLLIDLGKTGHVASLMSVDSSVLEGIVANKKTLGAYSDWQTLDKPGERAMLLILILNRKSTPHLKNFLAQIMTPSGDKEKAIELIRMLAEGGDQDAIEMMKMIPIYEEDLTVIPKFYQRMETITKTIHEGRPDVLFRLAGILLQWNPSIVDEIEAGQQNTGRWIAAVTTLSTVTMACLLRFIFKILLPPKIKKHFDVLVGDIDRKFNVDRFSRSKPQVLEHLELRGLSKKKALAKLNKKLPHWIASAERNPLGVTYVVLVCEEGNLTMSEAVSLWIDETRMVLDFSNSTGLFSSTTVRVFVWLYAMACVAALLKATIGYWFGLFINDEDDTWCFFCGSLDFSRY